MLPDLLTRRDWYERLAARASEPPRWLGTYERDVLMEASAHAAITDGATPPFHLRSALIGEVVELYDAVRRQRQDVAAFERLVLEPLALEAESEGDAGAERMLRQTRFLAATFRNYEARREALGACDEHTLRDWLMATRLARPYRRVLIAVADHTRDGNGLWSADFDLIARLPDVTTVDVVATEAMLATGWFERLHDLLPGLAWVRPQVGPRADPMAIGTKGSDPSTLVANFWNGLTRPGCSCRPPRLRPTAGWDLTRRRSLSAGIARKSYAIWFAGSARCSAIHHPRAAGPHRRRLRAAAALCVSGARGLRAGRHAV